MEPVPRSATSNLRIPSCNRITPHTSIHYSVVFRSAPTAPLQLIMNVWFNRELWDENIKANLSLLKRTESILWIMPLTFQSLVPKCPQDIKQWAGWAPLTIMATVPALPVIILPPSICSALQVLYTHMPALHLGIWAHARPERIRTWLPWVRKEGHCGPYGHGLAGTWGGGKGGRLVPRLIGTTVALAC